MKKSLLLACMLSCAGVEEPQTETDVALAEAKGAVTTTPPPSAQTPLPQPAPIDWEESTEVDPRRSGTPVPRRPLITIQPRAAIMSDRAASSWGTTAGVFPIGAATLSADGNLVIQGGDGNDTASATIIGSDLSVYFNGYTKKWPSTGIKKVLFAGGKGDDIFFNNTSLPSTANGQDGNDVLSGGSGADLLVGGGGQDDLYGNGGDDVLGGGADNDTLWGGPGNDELLGMSGNDALHGGDGRDSLNGGTGNDSLFGDDGMDLLVSVGLGLDSLTGGTGNDNFWRDVNDSITDASSAEASEGYLHVIGGFRGVSYNGGAITLPVGLEPLGEDLPDPLQESVDSFTKKNYDDHPLFSSFGPDSEDIDQGSIGDCYFVARLAAFAHADPEYIRKAVAPLGDGSFAVRLVRNGFPDYVRVDADFWHSGDNLGYANFGDEGSLWVAVIEKAFAIARRDQANYASIDGGNGDTFSTLPYTQIPYVISDFISKQMEYDWFNAGQPNNFIKTTITASNEALMFWIDQQLDNGHPMITGAKSNIKNSTPIIMTDDPFTKGDDTTWRRGEHVYMIDHVLFDVNGYPYGIVLRDPHGLDRTITDPVRLHYCIGRATRLSI